MIILFTDFGQSDPYVGQLHLAAAISAPQVRVIDLFHNAPMFKPVQSGHLLAALGKHIPAGSVVVAVVDPGVGSERKPLAVKADGVWFVGPENGLLDVVVSRAVNVEVFEILWRPESLSPSFHGRDLFLPFALKLESHSVSSSDLREYFPDRQDGRSDDFVGIIFCDHYGNLMTGIKGETFTDEFQISVNGHLVSYERTFSDALPGTLFWYRNSIGLVEIAANCESAQDLLGASVGDLVSIRI